MKKKILSLLTAVTVAMTMLPMNSAFADPQPMPQIIMGELEIEGLVKPVAGQKPQIQGIRIKPGSRHADDYVIGETHEGQPRHAVYWTTWNEVENRWETFLRESEPGSGTPDPSMENNVFETGKVYELNIRFEAKEGKSFKLPASESEAVTVKIGDRSYFADYWGLPDKISQEENVVPGTLPDSDRLAKGLHLSFYFALGNETTKHTVQFETNNGTNIDPVEVSHGYPFSQNDRKTWDDPHDAIVHQVKSLKKTGYKLKQWSIKDADNLSIPDVSGKKFYVLDNIAILKDTTFVAEWEVDDSYVKQPIEVRLDDMTVQYGNMINPHANVVGAYDAPQAFTYTYKGIGDTVYAETEQTPQKLGTYQIKAVLISDTHKGEKIANLTITPKEVTITGAKAVDRPYEAGDTTVSIVQSGAEITGTVHGEDIRLTYPPTGTMVDANAGTNKTVTATFALDGADKGNYVLTQQPSITVNITKADPNANPPSNVTATVGQKLKEAVIGQAGTGEGAWTWNEPETVLNEAGAKSYPMTFTPSDATNYNTKSEDINVTVSKKSAPGDVNQEVRIKVGDTAEKTINVSGALPQDKGATTYAKGAVVDANSILNGEVSVDKNSGEVRYQLKDNAQAGQSVTVPITATMANYENATFNLTILVTEKDVLVATVKNFTKEYDGAEIALDSLVKKATFENNDVAGTWNWAGNSDPNAMKSAGTYPAKLIFTPTETNKYENAEATFSITITKANSTGAPTFKKITEANKTLADADLQNGTLAPEGNLAWELPLETKVAPNGEYKWVFTPNDATNYNALSGKVVLYQPTSPSGNSGGGYSGGGQSSVRPDSSSSSKANESKAEDKKQENKAEQKENKPSNAASEAKVKAVLKIGSTEYKANDNTETKSMDVAPMIREGRTMLPARMISELLGVNVHFNSATKTAKFIYTGEDGKENTIELTLGQPMMKVNGENKPLTAKVDQVRGRIILPLTDVQKALKELGLNIDVEWDAANKEVIVK